MKKFSVLDLIGKWSKQYANLPDRYIERRMRKIFWETPRGKPQFLPRTIEKKQFFISLKRPWSTDYKIDAAIDRNRFSKPVLVEPYKDWSFFRGDMVEVLTGRDKGKIGKVTQIIQERNWILVEGLNTRLFYEEVSKGHGKYVQNEQPLLVNSQVRLVDPFDMKGTDIEWRYTEKGERVRVSVRSGRIIPFPPSMHETINYKTPSAYSEKPKDTKKADVEQRTFKPELKTFEMDIMDKMGIKEDRIPKKSYWY